MITPNTKLDIQYIPHLSRRLPVHAQAEIWDRYYYSVGAKQRKHGVLFSQAYATFSIKAINKEAFERVDIKFYGRGSH